MIFMNYISSVRVLTRNGNKGNKSYERIVHIMLTTLWETCFRKVRTLLCYYTMCNKIPAF